MLILYKRIDGVLHYHEARVLGRGRILEHWGVAGSKGEVKEHRLPPERARKVETYAALSEVLQPAIDQGFLPFDSKDENCLRLEYVIDGRASRADLDKKHDLEDYLHKLLVWSGLGYCDGGSVHSGRMEVCCIVADFEIASRLIAEELEGTRFADYAAIHRDRFEDQKIRKFSQSDSPLQGLSLQRPLPDSDQLFQDFPRDAPDGLDS